MDPTPWTALLDGDPLPWLLTSDDPAARRHVLTAVLGPPPEDPQVRAAHDASLTDPATRDLLDRQPDWEAGESFSGHDSPRFAPDRLLLAERGVGARDDPRVEHLLDRMLAHQEPSGRFPSYTALRHGDPPVRGELLCDSHAVTEVLVRSGRGDDGRAGWAGTSPTPRRAGLGRRFTTGSRPPTWYSALTVLDALAGCPALWRGAPAGDPDRRALAELPACLAASAVGDHGRVTPRSVRHGLTFLSAGQKRQQSACATARALGVLTACDGPAGDAAGVDVTALTAPGGQGASATSRTIRAGSSSRWTRNGASDSVPTRAAVTPSKVPSKYTSVTTSVSRAARRRGPAYSSTPVSGGYPTPVTVTWSVASPASSTGSPLPCRDGSSV
ncbi:hypothetical protein ACI79L_03270 [Geodermatophilus sp. SYSU D00684]